MKSARDLWKLPRFKIGYSHSTMTSDERMQRESNLIATIRKKLPEFAKACADDTELVLLHQDAFARRLPRGRIHAPRHGDQIRRSPWERSACDREESANPWRGRQNPVRGGLRSREEAAGGIFSTRPNLFWKNADDS